MSANMSYNTEEIRKFIEALLKALESVEQPTSDQEKITEWKNQIRTLCDKSRVYTLKIEPIESRIKKCNYELSRKMTEYNKFTSELNYQTSSNDQQIKELNRTLGREFNTPVCMEPEYDLIELKHDIESTRAKIKSIHVHLEHLTSVKHAVDIEYVGVESTIEHLNKLVADEESKPSRFKNNLDLELRRFTRLLVMLEMYDQYVAYAKTHKLGTDCYQYNKIEYLSDLKLLIASRVDTSDFELVIEFESYVTHVVSTCNEHHYYKLFETYVCACPRGYGSIGLHENPNMSYLYDPEFHMKYPNGGYKPGAARCSRGYICKWVPAENYGIGKSNIAFDDTGRMSFTILSGVPPGYPKYTK